VYITTSGIGSVEQHTAPGGARAREGDALLVTGDIGRHGAAILAARGLYGVQTELESDCAPLWSLVEDLLKAAGPVHCLRDATRGGLATVLCEIAEQSGVTIELDEESIPVCDAAKGLCGLLGLEPLYLACEGRMAVILPQTRAQAALTALRQSRYGANAAVIGRVRSGCAGNVIVNTKIGGKRLLAPPSGELLPRIC
ncbi:MAG: AIR synthase-related protein, partial [Clostridia bacterium]|nr:AIR synthase-related protein [Clostridia bacterium]